MAGRYFTSGFTPYDVVHTDEVAASDTRVGELAFEVAIGALALGADRHPVDCDISLLEPGLYRSPAGLVVRALVPRVGTLLELVLATRVRRVIHRQPRHPGDRLLGLSQAEVPRLAENLLVRAAEAGGDVLRAHVRVQFPQHGQLVFSPEFARHG
ncbi:hypothetical protein SDC9_207393 [bioreactor metagenome]|uniref:Uncharacterized protein n=1 Tax=bioreactor metagenome TaxID=1076179 RepID=A0A645J7S8_9ZZZZ